LGEGYSFQIELKYRAFLRGYSWAEVPIIFVDRRAGHSKMSSRIVIEALYRVWFLRMRLRSSDQNREQKT
jgi:dolichol-phosphate mannosyltransferase